MIVEDIKVYSHQILDVFRKTDLVEGKSRLENYFSCFNCLEGKPIIEEIGEKEYRLITYYENFKFLKKNNPKHPIECCLKTFNNDIERYITLLKQLEHGKARYANKDKYRIINILLLSISAEEIALRSMMNLSRVKEFIYDDDKYKPLLELSMDIQKHSLMKDMVKYLKNNTSLKEPTENHLISLVINNDSSNKFSLNDWKFMKWVLRKISRKYCLLSANDQISILNEINNKPLNILSKHFNKRCDELLGKIPPGFEEDNNPRPFLN